MKYYAILARYKDAEVPHMDDLPLTPEDWIKIDMFRKRLK